jgi:hypothetical protein
MGRHNDFTRGEIAWIIALVVIFIVVIGGFGYKLAITPDPEVGMPRR